MDKIKLYNGVVIPQIGLGTWQIDNDHIYDSFNDAIDVNYRHFDSAQGYFNEENLGRAIKDSKVKREDLFITTKVLDTYKSYEETKKSIEVSLEKLQTEYIDLLLIHCPAPWDYYPSDDPKWDMCNIEVWKAMVEFYKAGKVKAIGVSNFSIHDIQNLIDNSDVKPMVNQVPVYIGKTNWELINFCKENDIVVEAYSPIAHGKILNNEVVQSMASKYNCSIAQLCIAYVCQIGLVAIPKTLNKSHMKSNIEIDFTINDEDLEYLKQLKLNIGW